MVRSIVILTADPVTGDTDLVSVSAARGAMEALRAGDVTPDLIQVGRSDGTIEWRRIGTTQGPVLTDAQIAAAVGLALGAERKHGGPVEVELSIEGRDPRITRVRPTGDRSDDADTRTGTGR